MTTTPGTGRITLTLTTRTIKALRLLALLNGETQNEVAESFLIQGGLHAAVDREWDARKPGNPSEQPTPASPVPPPPAPATVDPVMPTPPEPAPIVMPLDAAEAGSPGAPVMATPPSEVQVARVPAQQHLPSEILPPRAPQLPPEESDEDQPAPWD